MFGYDEPIYMRPAANPPPRRQPEVVAQPRPKPRIESRPEPVARVIIPGPDDLGISLVEPLDLPPPEALGIEPK
jgi:hypothetical protein